MMKHKIYRWEAVWGDKPVVAGTGTVAVSRVFKEDELRPLILEMNQYLKAYSHLKINIKEI